MLDLQLAEFLAFHSKAVYSRSHTPERQFFIDKHLHFVVVPHKQGKIVAVCGSDDPLDWLTNTKLSLKGTTIGRAHRGFIAASQAIWPIMIDKINGSSKVWFTGHSLGGAIATILSAWLMHGRPKAFSGLYTFGSPRCVNFRLAKWMMKMGGKNIHRFVNDNDIVARIPHTPCLCRRLHLGYKHVGHPHLWDSDGYLSRYTKPYNNLIEEDMISDHHMINYYHNLVKYNAEM